MARISCQLVSNLQPRQGTKMITILQADNPGSMQRGRVFRCADDITKHRCGSSGISLTQQALTFGDTLLLPVRRCAAWIESAAAADQRFVIGLYVGTMLGSTLLFSFVTDRQQKYMFAAMPIFFIPFVIGVPASVMIYWITTNVWTICQQGVIKRTMGHKLRPAQAAAAAAPAKASGSRTPPSPTSRRNRKKRGGGGRR